MRICFAVVLAGIHGVVMTLLMVDLCKRTFETALLKAGKSATKCAIVTTCRYKGPKGKIVHV